VGRLRHAGGAPAVVVASGGDGARHAYWPLERPVDSLEAERRNRVIAAALGADERSCDPARILRPPGTMNRKYDPPRPVTLEALSGEVFAAGEVTDHLPAPTVPRTKWERTRRTPLRRPPASGRAARLRRGPHRPRGRALGQGELSLPRRPHAFAARLRDARRRLVLLWLWPRDLGLRPRRRALGARAPRRRVRRAAPPSVRPAAVGRRHYATTTARQATEGFA
jgi:hypothetical protein